MNKHLKVKLWTMVCATVLLVGVGAFFGRNIGLLTCSNGQQLSLGPSVKPDIQVAPVVTSLQDSFANVAAVMKPAVVNISTTQIVKQEYAPEFYFGNPFDDFFGDFFGNQGQGNKQQARPKPQKKYVERRFSGTGSGVIISENGLILTNNHVIGGASDIEVTLSDERKFKGKVIGADARLDLAVIKIEATKLPAAVLGDSDKIRVGDWAMAIGSPFGLEQTVTLGIISARRQSLMVEGQQYREMIQTDCAINQGNSGGPLINIKGEVVGINTAIYTPTGGFVGVGFATPINKAKEILTQLIEKGKVIRGWLGVEIRPVDGAVAKQFGLPEVKGALVNTVMKDAPAERSGLKRGDIILEFNGKPVKDVTALQDMVAQTEPKKKVNLTIWRNNKEDHLDLVIGEMPGNLKESATDSGEEKNNAPGQEAESQEWLGIKVKTLTSDLAGQLGVDASEKGVVVTEITPGSKADESGIAANDVIRAINRDPVTNIKEFTAVSAKAKLSDGIVFDINRGGQLIYLTIQER